MKKVFVMSLFFIFVSLPVYAVCKIDEVMTGAACSIQKIDDKKSNKKKIVAKPKNTTKVLSKIIKPKK